MIEIPIFIRPPPFKKEYQVAYISIHTTPDNKWHNYTIQLGEEIILSGQVGKEYSGHRNILHVLEKILKNENLGKLGVDYIKTPKEAIDNHPGNRSRV